MRKSEHTNIGSQIALIVESESKKLEKFIRRFVPNREDAKDLVQDVFYNLILGFAEIRDAEQIGAWLYQVARFKAIDFVRRKKPVLKTELSKDKKTNEDDLFEWLANHSPPEQEQKMWQDAVWKTMEKTLATMSKEQRNVFVWNELEDQSLKEIAARTGVSINTVISRKRYAVAQLKEALFTLYQEQKL